MVMVVDPVEAGFDVPAPGKRFSRGRSRTWATKILLLVAPLVLVGGLLFVVGVNVGSSRIPAAATIPAAEASRYGLTTFPVEQAAAYGASYLEVCLTHPDPTLEDALSQRRDALAAMSSAGVDPSCGWTGEGEAQAPAVIIFTGQYQVLPAGTFDRGEAAYLIYAVTMDGGERTGVTVPVWVTGTGPGTELRIVGPLGLVPLPTGGTPPPPEETGTPDSALAAQVREQVVEPFLIAWASSDPVQLDLVLTSDATTTARGGLAGTVTDPELTTVAAFTSREAERGRITYIDGDEARVVATVVWRTATGGEQEASYELTLRRVAGKWLVYDIAGGTLDTEGGATPEAPPDSSEPSSTTTPPASPTP